MGKILKYVKKYWYTAILAPLLMVVEVFMDMMLPMQMQKLGDIAIPANDINLIVTIGLKMLGIVFLGVVGGVLSGVATNYTGYKFANDLRKDIFEKIMHLSVNDVTEFETGSLITRVTNDVTQIQNFVSMALRMLVRSMGLFVLGIIFTLRINSQFGIIIVIALPIEILIMFIFLKLVFPLFTKIQKELDQVNIVVHENVTGARVVKAFGKEEYELDRFTNSNDTYTETLLTVNKYSALLMPLLTLIVYAAQMAIYYIGGTSVINFYNNVSTALNITIGEISAAVTYISMICTSLVNLGMTFTNMGRAMASVGRVNEILDCEIDIVNGSILESNNEASIEFKNVSFTYPKAKNKVLNDISFKINKGDTIAIVGSTGCGKSTLVGLLVRFYDVSEGQILVDGIDVREYDLNTLRQKVGLVLQKSELFAQTIKENIKWGNQNATDEEVVFAAKIAQAHDFIVDRDLGYDEFVEEKGTSLSGGQKQRLSIARAILKRPDILIFDDATSALDLVTEAKLHQGLHEYMQDSIKIIVAQRIATAKNADKIMVLDNGNVVAFDTHEVLLQTSDVYQDIYNSQLKREGVYDE